MKTLTKESTKLKRELLILKGEKLRRKEKKRAKEDLIFLLTEILGYPPFGKIHRELEEFIKQLKDRGVILLPRKHLKTTEITVGWTIQQLIKDPNKRIFITNERLENSKSFLREIKAHFEKGERFKEIFGDWTNEEEKWTETQILIKPRTIKLKEPTIQVGSVDTSLVSQHYDIIIADDLISRANVMTRERREKVKQYWKDLVSLLDEGGIMIDVGTRWHFDDLHGWLLEENKDWPRFIRICYDEKEEPIFPQKFSKESLQETKNQIGSYDFNCLYLNNPVDEATADFKRSWFENRYKEKDLTGRKLNTFITIDNAPSVKKGTDFQGIIVNSVDKEGRWYLRWVERFRGNTPKLIEKMFSLYNRWKPLKIGVEQKAFEDLIKPYLDQEMRRRNQFFTVVALKDRGVRKEDRIKGRLQPRFETKSIFLQKDPLDNTEDLIDELVRFPAGRYDDLADALQYQEEITYRPESFERPTEKKSEFSRRKPYYERFQKSRFHYEE